MYLWTPSIHCYSPSHYLTIKGRRDQEINWNCLSQPFPKSWPTETMSHNKKIIIVFKPLCVGVIIFSALANQNMEYFGLNLQESIHFFSGIPTNLSRVSIPFSPHNLRFWLQEGCGRHMGDLSQVPTSTCQLFNFVFPFGCVNCSHIIRILSVLWSMIWTLT